MDLQTLETHIHNLENSLLQPENRKSPEKMAERMAGDYFEF